MGPTATKHLNKCTILLQLLAITLRLWLMDMVDMEDMVSVNVRLKLRPRLMLRLNLVRHTLLVPNARTKRIGNAIKSLSRTLARYPARLARPSLIPPTLNSVRILSPPTVRRSIKKFPTPLLL